MFRLIFLLTSATIAYSCNSDSNKEYSLEEVKLQHIRQVVRETGFIDLPLRWDASGKAGFKSRYSPDMLGKDSLLFDADIHEIIGFFPDTSGYYAFLFHSIGDMLSPTIMTIDKKGNRADRQIINAGGCIGSPAVDIRSCYDSVWINKDLTVRSLSRIIGTVETNDPIPQEIEVCNERRVTGRIGKDGKIKLEESEVIDCNR